MEIVEVLQALRQVLELGWPAIVLLFVLTLWKAYQIRTDQYIEALREIAGLRPALAAVQKQSKELPRLRDQADSSSA